MILKTCLLIVLFLGILAQANSQACTNMGNYSQNALYTLALKSTGPLCREYNFGQFSTLSYITANISLSKIDCSIANVLFKDEKGSTLLNYCSTKKNAFVYNGKYLTVVFILLNTGSFDPKLAITITNTLPSTTSSPPASSSSTASSSRVPPYQTKTVYYINNSTCGQSVVPNDLSDTGVRIIGGSVVKPNSYPWQVFITDKTYLCGASLINNQWLLTAAHCVTPNPITAYFGLHDLNNLNNATSIIVEKMIQHENFDYTWQTNDIALFKLATPVKYSDKIRPICMPDKDYSQEGKTAIVTGWGVTTDNGPISNLLKEISIPIRPSNKCIFVLDSKQICAGDNSVNVKDSCRGDSGGPLITRENDKNQYVQDGIVSFGPVVCGGTSVYTNVYSYKSWIEKTIANN